MTICQQCGASMLQNQTTCPNCGAEVSPDAANETQLAAAPGASDNAYATAPNEAPAATGDADTAATNEDAAETTALSEADMAAEADADAANETASDRAAADRAAPDVAATTPLRPKPQRPTGGMNATSKALIAAGIAVALALGFLVWQLKGRGNEAINITPDDMSQLVQTIMPPQGLAQLANNPEERKEIAKQIRQVLAIGQEARAAGYADKPEIKRQLETTRDFIVAQMYVEKQRKAGITSQDQLFTSQEVDNFINEPGQRQNFDQFLKDVQELGMMPSAATMPEQQKEQMMKTQWGPVQVLARKAKAAGTDKERATQLMIKLQEAQVLGQKYLPTLKQRVEATDQEIDAYIAKHPELDPKQTRAKADEVLKRIKAGEDFAALAKEYSTDPGSKEKGGELGWFKRGAMVKQFEEAAFSMQPGQTSDVIETQFGFHIIQTEEKRTSKGEDGKDEEEVRARHILVGYPAAASANPFAPPQSPRDQAKAAVEKEKREKLIDEIAARQRVSVAEDYKVDVPPAPPMTSPHGGLPGEDAPMPPGAEPELPPAPAPKGNTPKKK